MPEGPRLNSQAEMTDNDVPYLGNTPLVRTRENAESGD